jgi:hypothetical protein
MLLGLLSRKLRVALLQQNYFLSIVATLATACRFHTQPPAYPHPKSARILSNQLILNNKSELAQPSQCFT